jgi:hypothetical protein
VPIITFSTEVHSEILSQKIIRFYVIPKSTETENRGPDVNEAGLVSDETRFLFLSFSCGTVHINWLVTGDVPILVLKMGRFGRLNCITKQEHVLSQWRSRTCSLLLVEVVQYKSALIYISTSTGRAVYSTQ